MQEFCTVLCSRCSLASNMLVVARFDNLASLIESVNWVVVVPNLAGRLDHFFWNLDMDPHQD